jgi:hypothetical protein
MEIVTVDGTAVVGVELLEDDVVERRHLGRERRRFGAPEASVRVGNLSQPSDHAVGAQPAGQQRH